MISYLIPLYSSYLYTVLSYYYYKSSFDAIFMNVYFYMPITLYGLLELFPVLYITSSFNIELRNTITNIIIHNSLYKKQDILTPFNFIYNNIGSVIITHIFLNLSLFQLLLNITAIFVTTFPPRFIPAKI